MTGLQGPEGRQGPQGPEGPEGPAGTTGQDIVEAVGTSRLTLTQQSVSYTLIPGLSTSVTVPPDAMVHVTTNGSVLNSGTGSSFAIADIAIRIDGVTTDAQRQIVAANTSALGNMLAYWSFGRTFSLSPGTHTIEVVARDGGGTADPHVSGAQPLLQSVLTVMVLKR